MSVHEALRPSIEIDPLVPAANQVAEAIGTPTEHHRSLILAGRIPVGATVALPRYSLEDPEFPLNSDERLRLLGLNLELYQSVLEDGFLDEYALAVDREVTIPMRPPKALRKQTVHYIRLLGADAAVVYRTVEERGRGPIGFWPQLLLGKRADIYLHQSRPKR